MKKSLPEIHNDMGQTPRRKRKGSPASALWRRRVLEVSSHAIIV